jgi:hypothetical protein
MMMLNLVMLILLNKSEEEKLTTIFSTSILSTSITTTLDIYNPTVLLIFTILLQIIYYCFLVQWTTQMVTILESRCPIFISMKPNKKSITTLNSYNKIRQTQQQPNKYQNNHKNSTTKNFIPPVHHLLLQPIRALSRSDYYYDYYHFALTKLSCISMIFGLIKRTAAHSLQRQTDDDNDENENCTNPTQKTKKKTNSKIIGLLISATKISMMIKMMKAKKIYLIFFQNPQFNLFSSFRLSFSQKPHNRYARYMYKKIMMLKTINLILLFFE